MLTKKYGLVDKYSVEYEYLMEFMDVEIQLGIQGLNSVNYSDQYKEYISKANKKNKNRTRHGRPF